MRALLIVFLLAVSTGAAVAQMNTLTADTPAIVPRGPYMIAGGNQTTIWRIDQTTGMVSYCIRDTVSNDPGLISQRPPLCSAWGR